MGLVRKLKETTAKRLVAFPLLIVLTFGCSAKKHIALEEAVPKIRNNHTTFYCDPVSVETPEGMRWNTMFYSWSVSPEERKKEIDGSEWQLWYSQHKKFMESAEECKSFFDLVDKRWRNYLTSKNFKVAEERTCNAQHQQTDLREVFPKVNPPYRFFECRMTMVHVNGVNKHWRAMLFAWNNPISRLSEAEWAFPYTIREQYMESAQDCEDFYGMAEENWKSYIKNNTSSNKNPKSPFFPLKH